MRNCVITFLWLWLSLFLATGCSSPPKNPEGWRESTAALHLEKGIKKIAGEISGSPFLLLRRFVVAVPEFESYDQLPPHFLAYLSDRLIYHLSVKNQCQLLERQQFYKIVEDYRLEYNDLFDPDTRQQLQTAGLDAVLIGHVLKQGKNLEIFTRLVMLETGQGVLSVRVDTPFDNKFIRSFK